MNRTSYLLPEAKEVFGMMHIFSEIIHMRSEKKNVSKKKEALKNEHIFCRPNHFIKIYLLQGTVPWILSRRNKQTTGSSP